MKRTLSILFLTSFIITAFSQSGKKPFQPSDFYKIPTVSDPQLSPDGNG